MELRELRTFFMVTKLRNMSRAAEELGMGQPTVTTHIRKLEEELGMTLFDRVRRPIRPTLAGEKLMELVVPLVEGIDGLTASISQAEKEGPVSVASTHDIIPHALLRAVKVFRATYPHAHMRIRSGHRSEALGMVERAEVDLGIVPGPERSPGFDFQPLFRYDRVLITPLGHPLLQEPVASLDQIARWPLILMGAGTYTRSMLEAEFQRKSLAYEVVVELDSMEMIKEYVAEGMGVSVGPLMAIDSEDRSHLGVVELGQLLPIEQAGIVTLRGRNISTPTRNFIEVMETTLATARKESA